MVIKIKPEIGKKYLLHAPEIYKIPSSFRGFYIGKNPVESSESAESFPVSSLEGHVFVSQNCDGEVECYCTKRTNNKVPIMWYDDQGSNPEWSAGFTVYKADVKLSKSEKQYLLKRMKEWDDLKKTQ